MCELDRDTEHHQPDWHRNQRGPDSLQSQLRLPLQFTFEIALSDSIKHRTCEGLADERADQTRKGRQPDVQLAEVEWGRVEDERDLRCDAHVHHVGDTEPEGGQKHGRKAEHDEWPCKHKPKSMLRVMVAFGNMNTVKAPEGGLGREWFRGGWGWQGVTAIADVYGLGQEEDLGDQTNAHEDERNPLRPAPAKRLVGQDSAADNAAEEWRHDNGESRYAHLLSFLVSEELFSEGLAVAHNIHLE